jgi:hypothetical protein
MGVSDEVKNVIPLKFLRKIKKFFFSSCKLNPGTYCIPGELKYNDECRIVIQQQELITNCSRIKSITHTRKEIET